MIITCEQCQARFKLADEKLKAEGTKVRCSKCQSIFTVFPPPPAPAEPTDREVATEPARDTSVPAPEPEPETRAVAPEEFVPPPADASTDFDFAVTDTLPAGTIENQTFSFGAASAPVEEDEFAAPGVDRAAATEPAEFDFDEAFAEQPPGTPDDMAFATDMNGFDFGATSDSAVPGLEASLTTAGEFDFAGATPGATSQDEFELNEDPPGTPSPTEFDINDETFPEEFSFAKGASENVPAGDFDFGEAPTDEDSTGFGFAEGPAADGESPSPGLDSLDAPSKATAGFGEVSFDDESDEGFSFDSEAVTETTAFGESADSWEDSPPSSLDSFDFEEPSFESQSTGSAPPSQPAELSFGEIDFSDGDDAGETFPSFESESNLARPAPPAESPAPAPAPTPPPVAAPPVQRPPASRPRSDEPLPLPARRRSPVSTMVITLVVLLVALCGAGGYLYMSGDGERLIGQLVMKIKGEKPAGPVEQLIGLNISGSSYVNNREAGQLLVIQGKAVNNFAAARSAIAVKGLLLDAAGKTIQQQTVFCGNPLSEEKLRTLKYAEIEEAMNNQLGDSLTNMNVKPGAAVNFTIVFRNVPKEMANINVEIVDSKPGGG